MAKRFKTLRYLVFILTIILLLISCSKSNKTTTVENKDIISPVFIGLINGELGPLKHKEGEEINLLKDINVIDNISRDVNLSIIDYGGYDKSNRGVYTIIVGAKDEVGNMATVNRKITVYGTKTQTFAALKINDEAIKYHFNNPTALKYTSSGTAFRLTDDIYVMTKEFFINEYNEHKNEHISNGNVPLLIHGVVMILDNDFKVKTLRIASGLTVEINGNGELKTSHLSWTNSLDEINGGGNLKGIIQDIENLIPNGGYVVFTSNKDEAKGKKFLIKNLYDSSYDGGSITVDSFNADIKNAKIEFVDNYTEEVEVIDEQPYGVVVKEDLVYSGIPFTIYYKNDNMEKPILYFFHGFGSDRNEGIMGRGEELAERGFIVVAMDAYLHGERTTEYFKNLSYGEKQKEIVNIQLQTAMDAKMLFDKYFKYWENVNMTKTYAYGVSMGAGSAFYLATIMDELKTFVSIVGSPSFYEFYQYKREIYNWEIDEYYTLNRQYYQSLDPLINYERLQDKNIFMGNGLRDTTVPLDYAKELALKLNSETVIYREYDTAHSSTPLMQSEAYDFLLEY